MKKRRLIALLLCATMVLSACGGKKDDSVKADIETTDEKGEEKEESKSGSVAGKINVTNTSFTLKDSKEKFGVSTSDLGVTPLYNVDPTAKFTFHFNSKVDPFNAVTVHTDSKCETNSMLYTPNFSYFTRDGGIDVIVQSNSSVLECADRIDGANEPDGSWGHANYYYIAIRYDMDADTPTKLDKPIIIPFTLRNGVEAPNVAYTITDKGEFQIVWNDTGADEYKIYRVFRRNEDTVVDYLDKERGYIGMHLEYMTSVPGGTTSYILEDNSYVNTSSYGDEQASQNLHTPEDYFVSAVKDGKESNFSGEVSELKYLDQLPVSVDEMKTFGTATVQVSFLPETAAVTMKDGSTVYYPVNYSLLDDTYASEPNNIVTYRYEVVGTKLSGHVDLKIEDGEYEREITSKAAFDSSLYEPRVSLSAFQSEDYPIVQGVDNRVVDLTTVKDYNPNSRVVYSEDALNQRLDLELSRIVTDGIYNTDPFSIEVVDYNDHQNDLEARRQQLGDIYTVDGSSEPVMTEPATEEETTEEETTEEETNEEETTEEETTEEETIEEETEAEEEEPSEEGITSDNVIDTVIDKSEEDIEDGDDIDLSVSGDYYIVADSVQEEYLARSLIRQDDYIRLDVVPSLLDEEYLCDVFFKVYYQNPYILGVEGLNIGTSDDGNEIYLIPEYQFDDDTAALMQSEIYDEANSVIDDIIEDGMSDDEKINAIYTYLEENTEYDDQVFDDYKKARESGEDYDLGDSPAHTTYGILCKKLGVCDSYARTFELLGALSGLDVAVITGTMDGGYGHAWNAVKSDGVWYTYDVTNNYKSTFVPYFVYNTNNVVIKEMGYMLSSEFALDGDIEDYINTDSHDDYYEVNGLVAHSKEDVIDIFFKEWNDEEFDPYAIRLASDSDIVFDDSLMIAILARAQEDSDFDMESLLPAGMYQMCNYIVVTKDDEAFREAVLSE